MEAVIIIGIIIFLIFIFSGSSSSTSTNTNSNTDRQTQIRLQQEREQAERQRQANLRAERERAEQQRQATLLRERNQTEQNRQAQIRRQTEQAEQQRQANLQQQLQNRQAQEISELQLCETNTSYKNTLNALFTAQAANFNFTTIRGISIPIIRQMQETIQQQLHSELNSGVTILMTENHLHSYNYAFGNMHQAKLKEAFDICYNQNHFNLQGTQVEVIDYGCGQGIGTVVLIDFLKSKNINCTIAKVKLIEPSNLAIKRAALNVRYSLRSANQNQNVYAINQTLDNINQMHLHTSDNAVKIHLLSNIIDVDAFNLNSLCQKISSTQRGKNIFICVSPNFYADGSHYRNQRQRDFLRHFNVNPISHRNDDIGNWKRYEIIFIVGNTTDQTQNNNLNLRRPTNNNFDDDLPF